MKKKGFDNPGLLITKEHLPISSTLLYYKNYTTYFDFVKLFLTNSYNKLERSTSMNYYNPYFLYPYSTASTANLLGNAAGRSFSFSSLLSGAQKTLNFVNQAIPVVKQVSPMMKNAKTMFRVMNEFKKVDTKEPKKGSTTSNNLEESHPKNVETQSFNETGPTFFV